MYTQTEQKILEYTIAKVKELFTKYPVPAHSFPHAEAVGNYAKKIATHENASSVFVCEMAGYLHDIGRVPESYDLGYTNNSIDQNEKGHHELS
ncbi:MAG: HD domain-containing protein, partial [Candidatus Magasanikbacteria bacterium]|nr:HD domain-containing protein [Candidatus Magasanikbacteria bacterium]